MHVGHAMRDLLKALQTDTYRLLKSSSQVIWLLQLISLNSHNLPEGESTGPSSYACLCPCAVIWVMGLRVLLPGSYWGRGDFLAPVGYLGLVGVMSRADHGAGGGRDAPRANGARARLAAWQTLLLKPRRLAYTTRTPLGVRGHWNCWTT